MKSDCKENSDRTKNGSADRWKKEEGIRWKKTEDRCRRDSVLKGSSCRIRPILSTIITASTTSPAWATLICMVPASRAPTKEGTGAKSTTTNREEGQSINLKIIQPAVPAQTKLIHPPLTILLTTFYSPLHQQTVPQLLLLLLAVVQSCDCLPINDTNY